MTLLSSILQKINENVFCKSKNDVILFIHGLQAI
jgi:hypothetical protein